MQSKWYQTWLAEIFEGKRGAESLIRTKVAHLGILPDSVLRTELLSEEIAASRIWEELCVELLTFCAEAQPATEVLRGVFLKRVPEHPLTKRDLDLATGYSFQHALLMKESGLPQSDYVGFGDNSLLLINCFDPVKSWLVAEVQEDEGRLAPIVGFEDISHQQYVPHDSRMLPSSLAVTFR